LVADGKDAVIIKDLAGVRHTIAVKDISSRKKSEKSLMPEASALGLSDQELADVAEFLMTVR
jgi:putative heme-binding domain-containing protein